MPIPFKSPVPKHTFTVSTEKTRITKHFTHRGVPKPANKRLLLATWNIANFGYKTQGRTAADYELIAHILERFDLTAIQEVNDDLDGLKAVMKHLGGGFDYTMSDTAGNSERLVYVFRRSKVATTNLYGEIALRKSIFPKRTVTVRYKENGQDKIQKFKDFRFEPFDRNPFITSFRAESLTFTLVNSHLYFGKFQNSKTEKERRKYARRVLEIVALAKWADGRFTGTTAYDKRIVLLGDLNVPAMDPKESTYKELVRYGWQPVPWVTKTGGTNLGNNKTYDQMVFAPNTLQSKMTAMGVFDFDKAIFSDLWDSLAQTMTKSKAVGRFNRHVKHHISDHRPLWVELAI